ncbi:hypothetical protein OS175_11075 [Marinicella sp. S1101]|uniref:hypothetical protein n=1 Tax=Marinicella marina TaxID=2996016 RepID=UPI002260D647|nr:hypothetical protein [Marinicella marina]MCX7554425.1 hypothetical protein [Marinicella marina]MDJ1140576.1 hypothetical protein [Marinicella marina]
MKKPNHQVWIKFLLLCSILFAYFFYLSYQYDFLTGGVAALITWSFFVLCTPIADAGFMLDFPIRLLFGVRMIWSEVVVWVIAIAINLLALSYFSQYYQTTFVTQTMQVILTTPNPYWLVILLSALGTFLSIRFGDELMDVLHHKERKFYLSNHFKHEVILFVFFLVVIFGYYKIISSLGIEVA